MVSPHGYSPTDTEGAASRVKKGGDINGMAEDSDKPSFPEAEKYRKLIVERNEAMAQGATVRV